MSAKKSDSDVPRSVLDDANPFKSLDKSIFRDAEGRASGKPARPSSAGKPASATSAEPSEDADGVFLRAMSGVARMDGKKQAGRTAGRGGAGSSGSRDAADGLVSMGELEAFRSAVHGKGAQTGATVGKEEDRHPADPRRRSREAVEQARQAAVEADTQAGDEDEAFLRAMQGVEGITARGRDVHQAPELAKQTPGAGGGGSSLQDLLDGAIEFQLEYSEEFIQGHVSGFDPVVLGRLRSGQYSPEGHLDLHGMVAQEAYDALVSFMRGAYAKGLRTVLLIPGRGRNSPEGFGVLREKLQNWLTHDPFKRVVLAFCTAQARDGGAGAVYVMLRKFKKSRGKIHWERTPSDPDLFI